MTEQRASLTAYFKRRRAECVVRYQKAAFWVQRKDARSATLHYGKLLRKLEAK